MYEKKHGTAAYRTEAAIDWYPWGQEALSAAEREHKPMLIVIGAQERMVPTEDRDLVRLTRRYFIPVQVDPQEEPAVAAVYAQAANLLAGLRSDCMEVLTDSAGNPFYIADAADAHQLRGLLSGVALNWNSDSSAYESVAAMMRKRLDSLGQSFADAAPSEKLWNNHRLRLQRQYDRENGGWIGEGKRLLPQNILFLLAYARYTGDKQTRQMAVHTLRQMALGGVRDQIGGGFFRGTRDARWQMPVFEKRLTDQAWMLRCYTEAYR